MKLFISFIFVFLLMLRASFAQTTLEVLNSTGTSSTINVVAGQSFSAEVFVTGLTTSLDSFNLTFAPLPTGVTLTGFTDTVPSGWATFSDIPDLRYGAANLSGSDITSSGELVLASFQTSSGTVSGSDTLTFTAPGTFQNLNDPSGDSIPYTLNAATLNVTGGAPEPSSWVLFLVGCGLLVGWLHGPGRLRKAFARF